MYKKILNKSIAIMLLTIMIIASSGQVVKVFAESLSKLEEQSKQTNNSKVEFDVYFKNEEQKTHSLQAKMQSPNSVFAEIAVKEGYLKNIKVDFSNSNLKVKDPEEMVGIQKIEENSKVLLNNLEGNTTKSIQLPIYLDMSEKITIDALKKESEIILTAVYVNLEGKESEVKKTIKIALDWKAETEAILEQNVTKYVPYNINGKKGLILQTSIKSNLKDNILPVKETKIEVMLPTINGKKPDSVKVAAKSTLATNGKEENITAENYEYNAENGKIVIKVQNTENEEKQIDWKKGVADEYIVTYLFSEEVLNSITAEGIKINQQVKSEIATYAETITTAENTLEQQLKEQLSEIVTFQLSKTNTLSKGYIYANYKAKEENKNETAYTQIYTMDVSFAEITDKLELNILPDMFVTEQGKEGAISNTYCKKIIINKQKMLELLGEAGTVQVLSKEGTILATLNKDTGADTEGNIIVELSEMNLKEVKVTTTKPVKEGKLEVNILKAINKTLDYSKKQMQDFKGLKVKANAKAISGEETLVEKTITEDIAFTEPTTKAEMQINPTSLSAIAENKDVEIRAILNTASLDNSLFENPVIEIMLSEDIQKIDITKTELLFEGSNKALQIQNTEIREVNGRKVIKITIVGEQTTYDLGSVTKGINIILKANITIKELTPTKQDKFEITVTNGEEQVKGEAQVQIVSPIGLTPVTSLLNYNDAKEYVTAMNETQKVKLESLSDSRIATVQNTLLNNYGNNIKNVSVLGRMIFKGNTGITGENKAATFDAPLASNIKVEGIDANQVEIYYSEKADASKELSNVENGWTKEPTNLQTVKSYLIIMKSEVTAGSKIAIKYDITIPEKIGYNQIASIDYNVYYDNIISKTRSVLQDTLQSPTINLATATTPNLTAQITANVGDGVDVQEGQIVKYKVTVKNTGSTDATNIPVSVKFPSQVIYLKFIENEVGFKDYYLEDEKTKQISAFMKTIKAGESDTFEFEVRVKSLEDIAMELDKEHEEDMTDEEKTIKMEAEISSEGIEETIKSVASVNKIIQGFFKVNMGVQPGKSTTVFVGEEIEYTTYIENVNSQKRDNVVVSCVLPKGLDYEEAYYIYQLNENIKNIKYDEKTRTITYNIGSIDGNETVEIGLKVKVVTNNSTELIKNSMTVTCNDGKGGKNIIITNEVQNQVEKAVGEDILPKFETTFSCNIPAKTEVKVGTNLIYELIIENRGYQDITNLIVNDILPSRLQYISLKYEIRKIEDNSKVNSGEIAGGIVDGIINIPTVIPTGTKIIYHIATSIKELAEAEETAYIKNVIDIKAKDNNGNIVQSQEKSISHTIISEKETDPETKNKKIIGTVWYDENENGVKDDAEPTMENVKVRLLNNITGSLVKDKEGNVIEIVTKQDGKYEFTRLNNGEYTVIFLYDTKNYSATIRKDDISANINSDGIDSKIEIDGIEQTAAVTQAIIINDNSVYNIDLGLMENKKFDLKLDKYIARVTVQNPTGTATYEYNNTQFGKRELTAGYLNNTTLVIEYKIVVKNEGAIDGYVKKIVDYLPKELKFNSELNRDWYSADNGYIYNSSLSNTKIAPGETKEVTLLLSKAMTENSLGAIRNTAEIYESYNDYGVEDIDSTPGNALEKEDDMSIAELIISIRTGKAVTFIGLTLIIVVIIGVGAYWINKKVLRKI